ncbi:MAG: glycosyltransferase [Patescibacteria group bacterium]|nr:glycosyltransferase [Patescibacteria group bacterium]
MRLTVVLPALNEEIVLRPNAERVADFCASALPDWETVVVIVDNDSIDRTGEIGRVLAKERGNIRYLRLEKQGKGLAIRAGWQAYPADVYAFMDTDLATDLASFPEIVQTALQSGGVAIGSRFHRDSKVERSFWRSCLSWGYSVFHRLALGTKVVDLPCGFKAAAAPVVASVLPQTCDNGWFFDSEFVVRAERAGFAVREVPVVWREAPTAGRRSKVSVWRLVPEYCRRVMALRRELRHSEKATHGASPVPAVGASENDDIVPAEWRAVAWLALAAMVVTSIPPLAGAWLAHANGLVWKGAQFFSPQDMAVYLSYIHQAGTGHWLYEDYFTAEPLAHRLHVFWLVVGWCGGLLRLAPIVTYHLARVLTIPLLAVAAYVLMARFLERKLRLPALALFMFGSGIGPYLLPFVFENYQSNVGRYEVPIDLWASESNAFASMLFSAHFVASLALLLIIFWLLLRALESGRRRPAVGAGLIGLLLFSFHPFNAPLVYAVLAVWVVLQLARRRLTRDAFVNIVIFGLLSVPAVAYQYYLTHGNDLARAWASGNLCLTPAFWHVLAGLGFTVFFAPFGWWLARKKAARRDEWDFLFVWVIVQLVIIYFPLQFQRRLIEGIQFPLVVLSVPAIVALLKRWHVERWNKWGRKALLLLAVFVFLPASFVALTRNIGVYVFNRTQTYYQAPATIYALAWVRINTPENARFMAGPESSLDLVGWGNRRVFGGQRNETVNFFEKWDATLAFYAPISAGRRHDFSCRQGIDYVWCGDEERAVGECPEDTGFERVFDAGGISIYRVSGCSSAAAP